MISWILLEAAASQVALKCIIPHKFNYLKLFLMAKIKKKFFKDTKTHNLNDILCSRVEDFINVGIITRQQWQRSSFFRNSPKFVFNYWTQLHEPNCDTCQYAEYKLTTRCKGLQVLSEMAIVEVTKEEDGPKISNYGSCNKCDNPDNSIRT